MRLIMHIAECENLGHQSLSEKLKNKIKYKVFLEPSNTFHSNQRLFLNVIYYLVFVTHMHLFFSHVVTQTFICSHFHSYILTIICTYVFMYI